MSSAFRPLVRHWDYHAYYTEYQRMRLFVGVTIQTRVRVVRNMANHALHYVYVCVDEKANLCTCCMISATPRPIIWESQLFVKRNCALYGHKAVKHKNFKIGHLFACLTALYNMLAVAYI